MSKLTTVDGLISFVKDKFSIGIDNAQILKECIEAFFSISVPAGTPLTEDTVWMYRESIRDLMVYTAPTPLLTHLDEELLYKHKLSVSEDDERFISYFPTEKDLINDRRIKIKPGRYLARYTDLDNDKIKELVATYRDLYEPPELEIFTNAEDIVEVYSNGPNSCMTKDWHKDRHPVLVYAYSPQLAVAAIRKKGDRGRFAARCVVNVESNIYGRIYGDSVLLSKLLQRKGFREANANEGLDLYEGVDIPLISVKPEGDSDTSLLVMPYFDLCGSKRRLYVARKGWAKFMLPIDQDIPKLELGGDIVQISIPLSRTEGNVFVESPDSISQFYESLSWFKNMDQDNESAAELEQENEPTTKVEQNDTIGYTFSA